LKVSDLRIFYNVIIKVICNCVFVIIQVVDERIMTMVHFYFQ